MTDLKNKNSVFNNIKITLPLLLLVAAVFVTLTSYTTSPIFGSWYENDGKAFLFIAKGMLNGKVPYRDIFDHKGPVLYFIEVFGYMLTGSETGVWLLQIVNMFAALCCIFYGATEFISAKASFFTTLAVVPYLTSTLFGGNFSEEWVFGFSAAAVMLTLRYINRMEHNKNCGCHPFVGAFLGFAFCFTINIRVNNCITVATCVLFIVMVLIVNKNFKNLLQNAVTFIGGAVLPLIAPVIYFWRCDALDSMLYGSIIFNLKYSGANKIINQNASMSIWSSVFPLIVLSLAVCVLFIVKAKNKKQRLLSAFLLCNTLCLFAMYLVTGVTYLHYLAFAWPMPFLTYILLIAGGRAHLSIKGKSFAVKGTAVVTCLAVLSLYFFNAAIDPSLSSTKRIIKEAISGGSEYELCEFTKKADEIMANESRDSVYCLASSFSVLYIYDKTNTYPKCRYHLFYDFWKLIDGQVTQEVTDMMQTSPPVWLISKEGDWHDDEIMQIVENSYEIVYCDCGFTLYKLLK